MVGRAVGGRSADCRASVGGVVGGRGLNCHGRRVVVVVGALQGGRCGVVWVPKSGGGFCFVGFRWVVGGRFVGLPVRVVAGCWWLAGGRG